ncbi:MAG: hypothetical protein QXP81_10150, partial [Nitrososphaerota archaeon]
GACIDFHKEKPATIFIPPEELIQVENEDLPKIVVERGVRRILVDALWPSNVGILKQLVESGVEVWVLTRPSALHGWRKKHEGKPKGLVEWLERHHPEALKGFKGDIKNDAFDAVLLRYVKPKFTMRVTIAYLECWVAMILWRRARREHQRLLQQLAVLPISEEEKRIRISRSEVVLLEEAKIFVEILRKHHPKIDELFQKLRIESDSIAQAYCCELIVEVYGSRTLIDFFRKLGLTPGIPNENDKDGRQRRKKAFIHDKQAGHALNQLVLRVYRLNPRCEQDRMKGRCKKIAEKIWQWKERSLEAAAQLGGGSPG